MIRLTRTLAVLVGCLALFPATAAESRGNFNIILGARQFDDDESWDPVDEQAVIGANFDFGVPTWPVNWVFGGHATNGDESVLIEGTSVRVRVRLSTWEVSTGVVKYWGKRTRLYLGGGFALINADVDNLPRGIAPVGVSAGDTSIAGYVNGGLIWRIGKLFNVGFDARLLAGSEIEVVDRELDVDYLQAGLILGWGW